MWAQERTKERNWKHEDTIFEEFAKKSREFEWLLLVEVESRKGF